ncbi:alanine dehydrogenase [Candidatus Peregrinibacteria bacterium]|nr:alanine dehydrogenase [Candidatus Peregrinibacteria bacterium]
MSSPKIIGTIAEIKDNENRVGITPEGVKKLVEDGHRVFVQRHAGKGAGFHDHEYIAAGAEIRITPEEIVPAVDILVKVKEPLESEYPLLGHMNGKTLFTYLHLSAAPKALTERLLECEISGIAYETVEDTHGKLPLLSPMSEIAGVLSVQYGAEYLQRKYGGRGKTLGEIKNTSRARVVVYGAGIVGKTATKSAAGLGSLVTLFDINEISLREAEKEVKAYLGEHLSKNVTFEKPEHKVACAALAEADLLIGGVLVAGTRAPKVVSEEQIHLMKEGSVVVDVSIDQGGCVWGSKATTHSKPIFELDGKIYCCVANMPGQVAHQSTQALTSATLPYIEKLANQGGEKALLADAHFLKGLNTYRGHITYESVAKDLQMIEKYVPAKDALHS